jgi:hypothetical protein
MDMVGNAEVSNDDQCTLGLMSLFVEIGVGRLKLVDDGREIDGIAL